MTYFDFRQQLSEEWAQHLASESEYQLIADGLTIMRLICGNTLKLHIAGSGGN